ncbi:MAG: efflux RND transporter periplasmic adaptor subunit [Terriglobales bacterium]
MHTTISTRHRESAAIGFSLQNSGLVKALGGTALAVVLLAAFVNFRQSKVPVRADRAQRQTLVNVVSTNGKIEPVENFEAHAPIATTVQRVLVQAGDTVKAGQLLLELDASSARAEAARALAQLRSAQAQSKAVEKGGTREEVLTNEALLVKARTELESAQRNLEAMRKLRERRAASVGELQEAENRFRRAQAEVELLEQKLKNRFSRPEVTRTAAQLSEAQAAYDAAQNLLQGAIVRAPRAGMVYSLPVRPGTYVSAGDLLVQVADLSRVQARAFVDEPDIGKLAAGQKVEVSWDGLPDRTWSCIVTGVPTTVILRGTRNVGELICQVDNADRKLLPNVNVNVKVETARDENALVVPREAIQQENGKRYVYEITGGELKKREVETSTSNLTHIAVLRGLAENAQVALGSTTGRSLRDGLPVRVEGQ